ncbi:hypothetical protein [Paenibacillus donghaensis]|uniref:Uncharacterized protein n=1 Tax=Paenibacillus donghaensis TaxID=414771 RepID=A0A2Z2KZ15_9BACL|nr:hypothetical protein [Paenibacillus donghaensis]ASA26048.1 hypothetical protein B9T62_38275 [Paenibacillus donghaensis]
MVEPQEQIWSDYFRKPQAAPSHLVPQTLEHLRNRQGMNYWLMVGLGLLNSLLLIAVTLGVLFAPLPLPGKLAALLSMMLWQSVAAAVLLFCIMKSAVGGPSTEVKR